MKNICFIISIIGIFILLIIINNIEPKNIQISSINNNYLNKQVKIAGQVISNKIQENNFTIFNLRDKTGQIQVICNCPNIQDNQNIEVIGKVATYESNLQVNADKILLIK